MQVVPPPSRLRRSVRRLALAICAVILGAGFTPALPSTVEPVAPAPVSFNTAAAPAPPVQSTVDEEAAAKPSAAPVIVTIDGAQRLFTGRHVGAVAGRAPPAHPA